MENQQGELTEWRDFAAGLVAECGERALALYRQGTKVHQKTDGTVVTDIDREIERFIRERITATYPDHAIYGEEYGGRFVDDVPLWAIDPVDGTTNLANGLPHWGVSIGLIAGGEPAVGALSFPLLGETFVAGKGLGATRNGETLPVLPPGGPTVWEDAYAICSYSARYLDFFEVPTRLRIFGSAALELCWTATGQVRGCQSIGTSLYDVAAGMCVAREVGARAGWLFGDDWHATDGTRINDVLLCAPPLTLEFLRSHIRLTEAARQLLNV